MVRRPHAYWFLLDRLRDVLGALQWNEEPSSELLGRLIPSFVVLSPDGSVRDVILLQGGLGGEELARRLRTAGSR